MSEPSHLLDRHRSQAIHFLDQKQKPATIACGTAVKTSYVYTIDTERVTCRQCWKIAHPPASYFGGRP